ncbi:MAG: polysaccharide export protein [Epsilonproteobacteria bacterium]|nr:polysaccharide export protein [Campylobacterota bacterium]
MFVKNAPQSETPSRVSVDQTYKIKPHDRLSIIFFEYPELSTKSKDLSESDVGIEVHTNGTITMPIIGEVVVAGKSKDQVVDMLYRRYSSYLEKPALRVEILNQKIYVLGEVKNPGSIELLKHRTITPLKAIAERGGLTDFAQRDVIKVVRGNRESYQVFHIDLTDMHSVHNNNVGLLPDDIVYVAHNRVKDFNLPLSGANPSLSWINTLFSTLTVYQVWK